MDEWMFWEQYSHEPYIAVCASRWSISASRSATSIRTRSSAGYAALARMEHQSALTPYLAGDHFSLADVSLLAYTRVAPEGGFHLEGCEALGAGSPRARGAGL